MGVIRAGMRSEKRLSEFKDEFIGIQYAGLARNITTTIPADKARKEPERTVTQDVVRGRVFQFNADGTDGVYMGETLVFQTVLAQELKQKQADWFTGVLTETPQAGNADRSVYTLESPTVDPKAKFDAAERLLTERDLV